MNGEQQNSFVGLKRYGITAATKAEAEENHATECLATCLRVSDAIRAEFIRFLLSDDSATPGTEANVRTQVRIGDGILDLVIERAPELGLLVEVKVGSGVNQIQLKRYEEWAKSQPVVPRKFLLIRNRDSAVNDLRGFEPRLWGEWVSRLKRALNRGGLTGTDANLGMELLDYLEQEGIAMNFVTESLKHFDKGIQARATLDHVFRRVKKELSSDASLEFCVKGLSTDKEWPRLEIGRSSWVAKLGGGQPNRVGLWFGVPSISKDQEHDFRIEFGLWDRAYGAKWDRVEGRLNRWFEKMDQKGCKWTVYRENWHAGTDNLRASEITSEPMSIIVWKPTEGRYRICENQWLSWDVDQLVLVLTDRVRELVEIVNSLT